MVVAVVRYEEARELALKLPEACQGEHFEVLDFRVRDKIFATLPGGDVMIVRITPEDQRELRAEDPGSFRRVDGYWGDKGWTHIRLSTVAPEILAEAVTDAWRRVAPKRVVVAYDSAAGSGG